MATPVDEEPSPGLNPCSPTIDIDEASSLDTREPGDLEEKQDPSHLAAPDSTIPLDISESREVANRLVDDLEILRAERLVSTQEQDSRKSRSRNRSPSEPLEDDFQTSPPPSDATPTQTLKSTILTRSLARVKKFPRFIRYFCYLFPVAAILTVPIWLDIFLYHYDSSPVGGSSGVQLLWFGIWLEVIWAGLWASRLITATLPAVLGAMASGFGSHNSQKWKDIGRHLELPTALFMWLLAILASFSPILNQHLVSNDPAAADPPYVHWIDIVNKVIIALFVMASLNFAEKMLIQWIATSFHMRTYSLRIAQNKMATDCLVRLYAYAKVKLEAQDPIWGESGNATGSGSRTPLQAIQDTTRQAWSKVGDVANRMAGDFTGRKILRGNHPRKVVMELLRNTASSHTMARVFYRTYVRPEQNTITLDDLYPAFSTNEEAEACFNFFDRDLNGDISMEELEGACNEVHMEKKAIAASLKDLDSVIKKLDRVFMFLILVITVIVFVSIISNSAAAALTSTGTVILGLAWVLQATAQEFLQSIIFVFVKHPFDVGDRVTVYGNTGLLMRGDDYYVQEISLLYTEFKKMEGHVVQAPNSLLNTLFILNQRRSNGLADPIELKLRFGTSEALVEELKARMRQFVEQNKRDYGPMILTEVRTLDEVYSMTMNFIFFHKSSFQNEILRLQRHNKFAVELMNQIRELGIEGPRVQQPGGVRDWPIYHQVVQPPSYETTEPAGNRNGNGSGPSAHPADDPHAPAPPHSSLPQPSLPQVQRISSTSRRRWTDGRAAAAAINEVVPDFGDVYENRRPDPAHAIKRLASIRQAPSEGSSSGLENVQSHGSVAGSDSTRKRNLWGRTRSRSIAVPPLPEASAQDMV